MRGGAATRLLFSHGQLDAVAATSETEAYVPVVGVSHRAALVGG